MYQITEARGYDVAKNCGVYGENERDEVLRDWEVWLDIAKTQQSKVFLYHNDRLISSMDCREKDDE